MDVLKTTIEIGYNGEVYVFKIPSPLDEIGIGSRQKAILLKSDETSNGDVAGLGSYERTLLTAMATFEKLIVRGTTATWVWTPDDKTRLPIVDSSKFPPDSLVTVLEVVSLFNVEFDNFLSERNRYVEPVVPAPVESESNT